jgi:hypothetical protein
MARRLLVAKTKFCENLPPLPEKADFLAWVLPYASELANKWIEADARRSIDISVDYGEDSEYSDPIDEFLKDVTFPIKPPDLYELFQEFHYKNYSYYKIISKIEDYNNISFEKVQNRQKENRGKRFIILPIDIHKYNFN